MVETLDCVKMARTLNNVWSTLGHQRTLRVLVQVNTSGEKSRPHPLPPSHPQTYSGEAPDVKNPGHLEAAVIIPYFLLSFFLLQTSMGVSLRHARTWCSSLLKSVRTLCSVD